MFSSHATFDTYADQVNLRDHISVDLTNDGNKPTDFDTLKSELLGLVHQLGFRKVFELILRWNRHLSDPRKNNDERMLLLNSLLNLINDNNAAGSYSRAYLNDLKSIRDLIPQAYILCIEQGGGPAAMALHEAMAVICYDEILSSLSGNKDEEWAQVRAKRIIEEAAEGLTGKKEELKQRVIDSLPLGPNRFLGFDRAPSRIASELHELVSVLERDSGKNKGPRSGGPKIDWVGAVKGFANDHPVIAGIFGLPK